MAQEDYFAREYFTLHPGKRRYLDYLLTRLRGAGIERGPVLDVGCAYGLLLARLAEAGLEARGLEISRHACEVASAAGLRVDQGSAEDDWPFSDGSFRAVVMNDVLEHLHHPGRALRECRRVLAPSGLLLAVTTNRYSLARPVLGRRWSFHQDPTHVQPFSSGELRRALLAAGFTARVEGIFNFLTAGESAPLLRPLRRLGLVLRVPWVGESLLAIGHPGPESA